MGTDVWCRSGGASHCAMVLGSSQCGGGKKRHNICVPQRGNRGYPNCCVYEFYSKAFLRTLVGGQGLRDDAIDYIQQHSNISHLGHL